MTDWAADYTDMLASLPDVNEAIQAKYAAQRNQMLDPDKYQQAAHAYAEALEESRRIQSEFYDRARAAGICVSCLDPNGPRHNASSRCESGGRNHCTCDVCF